LSRKEAVLRLSRRIYDSAKKAGADVVCLACPMCHNNLDMRQAEYTGAAGDLPVVYLTQLMGLAFGVSEKELGLDKHFVPAEGIGATCPV
jgi:heterodisulfide reductase subunit B